MFGTIFISALFVVVATIVAFCFWLVISGTLLAIGALGFMDTHDPVFLIPFVLGLCCISLAN